MNDEIEEDILEAEGAMEGVLDVQEPPPFQKKRFLGQKIDGQLHGVLEQYGDNEQLLSHQSFEKGILHGEARRYEASQQLKEKINYKTLLPKGFYSTSLL
mgnify:CR=1 FL=1